jgi:steroid delta-isomerase-like uncharacterized protein
MRIAKTTALLGLLLGALACDEQPAPTGPTPTTKPTTASTGTGTAAKKPETKQPLTPEQKLAKVKECHAAMAANDMSKLGTACFAENAKQKAVDHLPPMEATGIKAIEANARMWMAAFSGTKMEIGPVLVNGDNVVAITVMRGKNTGELMGMPATNKDVSAPIATFTKLGPDGLAVEEHSFFDQNGMAVQLGLAPKEAAAMARTDVPAGFVGEPRYIVAKNDQTEKDNLAAYEKGLAAFNSHKVDDAIAGYADDALFRDLGMPKDVKGKEEIKKGLADFYKMSSDVKSAADWKLAAGEYVAAGITLTGTNDGPMGPMPKTGKSFKTQGVELMKFEGGKVKEHWLFFNGLAFAVQLGLAPDPGTMAKGDDKKEGDTKAAKDDTKAPPADKGKETAPAK